MLDGGARGAPGGPEVMGCVVTQPQILFSFVERKERGGGYLSDRILPFLLGEIHVLRVSVDTNYVLSGSL